MPTVSIITINYNQTKVTCALLESIRKIAYTDLEVIVIDNYSSDNPEQVITTQYPEVKFIRSTYNSGFAGGNNLGMMAAKGKYFLLVNNDTEISNGMIETLLATAEQLPDAGIICPKICYYEPPHLIQYVGYTPINPYTARNKTIGNLEHDKGQYHTVMRTHYAHGAAMLLPRSVVEEVGMMPEDFFLYYEELDWCEQIKRKKYQIYVEPNAVIYHKESVSTGKNSPLKTYYLTRNRILFMRRNAQPRAFILFCLFFAFCTIPKNLFMFLMNREWQHITAFVKGILANWQITPKQSQPAPPALLAYTPL